MTEDKVVHHNPTPPPIYCSVTIKHKGQVGEGQGKGKKCAVQHHRAGGATHVFILSYPMSKQHLQRKRSNWTSK